MTRAKDISKIITDADFSGTLDVTGVSSFANGTNSAPSLTFTSDTNTGIYRGGTDILKFVTAGTDAITINASQQTTFAGNIDVTGTATTDRLLSIDTTGTNYSMIENRGAGALKDTLVLRNFSSNSGTGAKLIFAPTTSDVTTRHSAIAGVQNVNNNIDLRFYTSAGNDPVERMRINQNGDISFYEDTGTTPKLFWDASEEALGIGTASPARTLSVERTGGSIIGTFKRTDGPSAFITFEGSTTTTDAYVGIGADGDDLFLRSGNAEKLRIDSSGNVGIGTDSPATKLDIIFDADSGIKFDTISGAAGTLITSYQGTNNSNVRNLEINCQNFLVETGDPAGTATTERMRIDSSGNVGIGITPSFNLHVFQSGPLNSYFESDTGNSNIRITSGDGDSAQIFFGDQTNDTISIIKHDNSDNSLAFFTAGSNERMRIDSSGNVGIGTSSPSNTFDIHGDTAGLSIRDTSAYSAGTGPSISFVGLDNNEATKAFAIISGVSVSTDNGLLTFQTRNNGALTERMRIENDGDVLIGKTSTSITTNGTAISATLGIRPVVSNDLCMLANRLGTDGSIIDFRHDNTSEGNISISGTTVSFNGGHLSRWSQLADNTRDNTLVKGTVMTNLDQMAEWTTDGVTEDNEQLNCMSVSSVEGDANVAGVFVNWDNDDDIYTNDMNVAMTGDMVIRIAQGTTVARGDLLMSAGDGTAKPQGDDIVRSKTIAKVTSTNVSHTYDDGTYLVPCVLMAC